MSTPPLCCAAGCWAASWGSMVMGMMYSSLFSSAVEDVALVSGDSVLGVWRSLCSAQGGLRAMESTERARCGALLRNSERRAATGLVPGAGRLKCFGDGVDSTAEDVGAAGFIWRRWEGGERVWCSCEGGGGAWASGSAQGGTTLSWVASGRGRHIAEPCGASLRPASTMPPPGTSPAGCLTTFFRGAGDPSRELGAEVW